MIAAYTTWTHSPLPRRAGRVRLTRGARQVQNREQQSGLVEVAKGLSEIETKGELSKVRYVDEEGDRGRGVGRVGGSGGGERGSSLDEGELEGVEAAVSLTRALNAHARAGRAAVREDDCGPARGGEAASRRRRVREG